MASPPLFKETMLPLLLVFTSLFLSTQETQLKNDSLSFSFPLTSLPRSPQTSPSFYSSFISQAKKTPALKSAASPYNYRSRFKYSMILLVSLPIGTPPQSQQMILDTGSQLSWIQCHKKVPRKPPPSTVFDPSLSSSFSVLPCNHPLCKPRIPDFTLPTSCDLNRLCHYSYFYADGTLAEGNLVREKITFSTSQSTPPLILGCAEDASDDKGILGMNLGRLSFASQAKITKFSYCVPTRQVRPGFTPTGSFYLGENPNSAGFQYISLLTFSQSQRMPNLDPLAHTVALQGIRIGNKKLNIPVSAFRADRSGAGQSMIDSGSEFTYLVDEAYNKVREEVVRLAGPRLKKGYVYSGVSDMCFDGNAMEIGRLIGNMVFEFDKGPGEGSVGLPPHVWSNLFPIDSPKAPLIEVQYVWLPKGTYAKLQPDVVGFSDLPNHKAVLETSLRQHATLSEGDVITVNHGILTYKLQVLELRPSSSVSVLETDIEVDVVGPDSGLESSQPVLKPLIFGKAESGMVEEGNYNYFKFSIDNDIWDRIAAEDVRVEVRIEAETNNGDTDLYMSKHPLMFPTRHQHEWSSHDIGSKVLILGSKDKNLGMGAYSIGVHGFKGTTKYNVAVSVQENSNHKVGQQAGSSSSMDIDAVECRNCKHFIPSRSIALHEAFCSRHNIVCSHPGCGIVLRIEESKNHLHCDKCGQAFQQGEMEKHMKVFHEPLQCPCGVVLEKNQMVQHQASICPVRLITCRFCGDMVQAGTSAMDVRDRLRGLTEHESVCGSRTAPCDSCGRSVMLKEMDIHQIAVHQKS